MLILPVPRRMEKTCYLEGKLNLVHNTPSPGKYCRKWERWQQANNQQPQQLFSTTDNSNRWKDNAQLHMVKRLNTLLSWKKNSGLSLSTFTFLNFFQQQLHEVLQCFDVLNSTKCWFLSARWQESLEIFRHKMSSDVHCFVIHVRKINCVSHLHTKPTLNKLFKTSFLLYLTESIVEECCIESWLY